MISLILSVEGTGKLVCIPRILVEATLKVGVMSLKSRMLGPCSGRLTV